MRKICKFSFPAPWIKSDEVSTESRIDVKVNKKATKKRVNSEKNGFLYFKIFKRNKKKNTGNLFHFGICLNRYHSESCFASMGRCSLVSV